MDPVRIAFVDGATKGNRALRTDARREITLAVETVVPTTAVTNGRAEFGDAQCVVLAGDATETAVQNLYEQLRIAYTAYPTVVASAHVTRPFIDQVLADGAADFVYTPEGDPSARLLAARCRTLLARQ